ncbi:hypothetical protein L6452_36009 [Arctium lappa]|uniref:Uncharacterized protein n=1 Tax=Arctium lappa TaxID=4217 RepID=A0ACB8Y7A5_ARCLA|nr:hypothetical protein L6452_36009 [Arctium lappa]
MVVTGDGELGFDSGKVAWETATTSKKGSKRANYPILTRGALDDRPEKSLKFHRDGDRSLQLLVLNEEFLGCVSFGAETGLPYPWCGWHKKESPLTDARLVVVVNAFVSSRADAREALSNDPNVSSCNKASTATSVWRSVLSGGLGSSPLEGGTGEGESPVVTGPYRTRRSCLRVGLFGNAAPIGQ